MFENIVLGIKTDHAYDRLIELVPSTAAPGAKVHLVTFVRVGKEGDEPQRRERAERELERSAASLRDAGFDVSLEVGLIGVAAAHELIRVAEERRADLLVIGLGKRSRVGKALLGSDAQSAILNASCPVLVRHLDG